MSVSNGLCPSIFCAKIETTRLMRDGEIGRVLISCQSWHLHFNVLAMKVFFLICTLTWRVDNYAYQQGKGIIRTNER